MTATVMSPTLMTATKMTGHDLILIPCPGWIPVQAKMTSPGPDPGLG